MSASESMAVVVCVNDHAMLDSTLRQSRLVGSGGAEIIVKEGYPSAAMAYNEALDETHADIAILVHQDVYLPEPWEHQLREALASSPDTPVLGVFGIDSDRAFHGRVWSQGLGAELDFGVEQPRAVESLDELVLIVRARSGVRFDSDLPGYHLYGTDIAQRAITSGHPAVVFNAPVVHNSSPVRTLDDSYIQAYRHMQGVWKDRLPLQTCILPLAGTDDELERWKSVNSKRQWDRRLRGLLRPHRRIRDVRQKARRLGYEA
ncbi:MAG: glycosyltransferase [Phycisphaerales bacterium JB043]